MKFELRNVFSLKYHSLLETVFVSVSVFPEGIARCYIPRVYFLLSWGLGPLNSILSWSTSS